VSDITFRLPPELVDLIAERVAGQIAERWLSPSELAEHFGCSVRTVSTYTKAGMPHARHGTRPVYKATECDGWLRERSGGGTLAANGPAPLPRPGPGQREVGPDAKQAA
jgi:hypothetical protein